MDSSSDVKPDSMCQWGSESYIFSIWIVLLWFTMIEHIIQVKDKCKPLLYIIFIL